MKAAVCRSFGEPLSVEEVVLRQPGDDEVEVKLDACAICHSDIHYADGSWGGDLPAVYGHEASGRVVATGRNVTDYAKGDTVVVTLLRSCGKCRNCWSGMSAHCEKPWHLEESPIYSPDGSPLIQGLGTGAFAQRVVVHESQIFRIPDSIPMDSAALLSCGVVTGFGAAANTAKIHPGAAVAVIGTGGVGLNAVQGARACGAESVIAVDISEEKLADARLFGATHGVLATSAKPHREIKQITGGRGVDFALVTVGSEKAYNSAMRYLAPGGSLVMVGMPPAGAILSFEPVIVAFLGQSVLGSYMGDTVLARDIPYLVGLYQQERLKLDELITGRFRLEEINQAIESTVSGKARRNVLVFD